MASNHNIEKNTIGINQPPLKEIKNSASSSKKSLELSSNFISSQHTGRYPFDFPAQITLDPSYTCSPDLPTKNQDSYPNKEIGGLSSEDPLYCIPNTEVDLLHCHTQSYLKSFGQFLSYTRSQDLKHIKRGLNLTVRTRLLYQILKILSSIPFQRYDNPFPP